MSEIISTLKKVEQRRAKFAWDCAKAAKANSTVKFDEYKSYAKSLPMLIKSGGLGPTLAFIRSKAKNKTGENTAYGQIYDDISKYFQQEHKKHIIDLSKAELVEKVIDIDMAQYRSVTIETLAFMQWLRRFADGLGK